MKKPNLRNLLPSQAHASMEIWASKYAYTYYDVYVTFYDGSSDHYTLEPVEREVLYKVGDEVYEIMVPVKNKYILNIGVRLLNADSLSGWKKDIKTWTKVKDVVFTKRVLDKKIGE